MNDSVKPVLLATAELIPAKRLPFLVWLVFFCTLLASMVKGQLLGFNVSGISWMVPLVVSAFMIVARMSKITFPIKLWLPWVLLLLIQLVLVDPALLDYRVSPLQRTAQVLTPLLVGLAMSTYRPSSGGLLKFAQALRFFAYLEIAGLFILFGDNLGRLASETMTILLLCVFFANRYLLFKEMKDIWLWIVLVSIPVLAVTRTVIVSGLLSFPLAFSPMSLARRLIFCTFVAVAGVGIFQLPQMQEKMFYSGKGSLSDVGTGEDFATSGRYFIWAALYDEAQRKHWTGHGTGAAETATYSITPVGYPHNDWLLTYYDYGVLGIVIYSFCLLATMWHGFSTQKKVHDKNIRLLLLTGVSAFVPYMIVMYTDNIMVYASFFGMLHYTFLGLGYGALQAEQDAKLV